MCLLTFTGKHSNLEMPHMVPKEKNVGTLHCTIINYNYAERLLMKQTQKMFSNSRLLATINII